MSDTAAGPDAIGPPRVYIETNFVVHAARGQRQVAACQELLTLAEADRIRLAVPAFALVEPWQSFQTRRGRMNAFLGTLEREAKALDFLRDAADAAGKLQATLTQAFEAEQRELETLVPRLAAAADVLPVDAAVMAAAFAFADAGDLRLPDAVVAAAVLADAGDHPGLKLFLTTDRDLLALKPRFQSVGVDLKSGFAGGLAAIRRTVDKEL